MRLAFAGHMHAHRAVLTHTPKIVAVQIDDHRQLGGVLLRLHQLFAIDAIQNRIVGARPRALDRPRHDRTAAKLKKQLGRGRHDPAVRPTQAGGMWGGVALLNRGVYGQGIVNVVKCETLSDVDLIDVAGGDVLQDSPHRPLVCRLIDLVPNAHGGQRRRSRVGAASRRPALDVRSSVAIFHIKCGARCR